jgi:phospholipase C
MMPRVTQILRLAQTAFLGLQPAAQLVEPEPARLSPVTLTSIFISVTSTSLLVSTEVSLAEIASSFGCDASVSSIFGGIHMRRLTNKAVPAFLMSLLMTTLSHAQVSPEPSAVPGFPGPGGESGGEPRTATPIKHLVIIFGENESFDHYFGTYPVAKNPQGEPAFYPRPFTPPVNGLTFQLLNHNPNFTNTANGTAAANPFRLDRTQAHTGDMNHGYTAEQAAFDDGKMDLFPLNTGNPGIAGTDTFTTGALVMGYYDGNTVTALWNYAQHFALSDNSFSSQFGPSSPGAINVISGLTNGAVAYNAGSTAAQQAALAGASGGVSPVGATNGFQVDDGTGTGTFTLYGDADPTGDVCATTTSATATMTGNNIGDLLNARNISWGWFQGGFNLLATNTNGTTGCARSTTSPTLQVGAPTTPRDYVPHHAPFQYYATTRNPNHTRPSSVKAIGTSQDGGANHQYDINDFFAALAAGNLPSVSYLKAAAFQDAHPGNSDPLDEQTFVVTVINALQDSPFWESTAVIIAYDDSDGWYDHVNHVINPSFSVVDDLQASGKCEPLPGTFPAFETPLPGINGKPVNGRCGYGPRQPLLVISPYSKHNFVDHEVTDQSSVVRFIEDNWLDGERIKGSYDAVAGSLFIMFDFSQFPYTKLKLDPTTGAVEFP